MRIQITRLLPAPPPSPPSSNLPTLVWGIPGVAAPRHCACMCQRCAVCCCCMHITPALTLLACVPPLASLLPVCSGKGVEALRHATHVLSTVPPDADHAGDPVVMAHAQQLGEHAEEYRWVGYISSTSGGWGCLPVAPVLVLCAVSAVVPPEHASCSPPPLPLTLPSPSSLCLTSTSVSPPLLCAACASLPVTNCCPPSLPQVRPGSFPIARLKLPSHSSL